MGPGKHEIVQPPTTEKTSVLSEKDIKRFIADRKIAPEDFPTIEELATFPNSLVVEQLHNVFNMYKERSAELLSRIVRDTKNPKRKRLYELALEFANKYGWAASWNLIRILEYRKLPYTLKDIEELK